MHYSTLFVSIFTLTSLFVNPVLAVSARAASAPVSPSQIDSLLASVTNQNVLTIPSDARKAFKTLSLGGKLSTAEEGAVARCLAAARANNEASKAGEECSVAGNIIFDTNKVSLHACEGASVSAQPGSKALTLLKSNVANLNTELRELNGEAAPVVTVLA